MVGRTAKERKATSWGHIDRVLSHAEAEWAKDRISTGLSSGEGLIWECRDPIKKREKVKRGKEVKYEEVEVDPGISDKRMLVMEPEFANVLKVADRQGNTISAVLRNPWDGRDLRTMTKNSPARATGAHVSIIGHITSQELQRYLSATETANGFANRFLWICVKRSKLLPDGGCADGAALDRLAGDLAGALEFALHADLMARDTQARSIWHGVYERLSEGCPGLVGALLGRAEAHVMRLAMLYALLDRSATIGTPHMMAALSVWSYVEQSIRWIWGDSLGDPVADEVLRFLRGQRDGATRTEIRDHFGRHQSDGISRALNMLLEAHLVTRQSQQTAGWPVERWRPVRRQPKGN
jgi:hypothetical protein